MNEQRQLIGTSVFIPVSDDVYSPKRISYFSKALADGKIEESDVFVGFVKRQRSASLFTIADYDDEPKMCLCIEVWRNIPETDEQFLQRCKLESEREKQILEQDRLLYLKLKARFENE